jgi:hypothetical protein
LYFSCPNSTSVGIYIMKIFSAKLFLHIIPSSPKSVDHKRGAAHKVKSAL